MFGFGAEILRLCLVRLVQASQRRGDEMMQDLDYQGAFETYLLVVNQAICQLCKVNQFTEASLVCERADELRRSLPLKFTQPKSNIDAASSGLLQMEAAHVKRRIKL